MSAWAEFAAELPGGPGVARAQASMRWATTKRPGSCRSLRSCLCDGIAPLVVKLTSVAMGGGNHQSRAGLGTLWCTYQVTESLVAVADRGPAGGPTTMIRT